MKKLIFAFICLLLAVPCQANPIPWPPPASMPLEDMYVEIQPGGDGLHAVFTGDFTFTYIPEDVNSMLFPVPPGANNIGVWQDNVELTWAWSSRLYPTILKEIPNIPMIEWQGPFPVDGAVFTVDYEHNLIKRPSEFIFFYALGTGKYFSTYEKTTTAYFDILLPVGFTVAGVWLDETAHEYEVVDGHLMVTVESWFGPITNDLIVSLVPTTIYVATDGNDVTGDGSEENPFRTIQKGIDTAADGYTVIVQPGLYEENINFLGKNITLKSIDPTNEDIINSTIIDGNDANSVVTFSGTESSDCVLTGFTITNGMAAYGGGIYGNGTIATIENNTICGNEAIGGGKIGDYGAGGGLLDCDGLIQNNIITGNSGGFGGGLDNCDGVIRNNIISDNGWYAGGGLFGCGGTISNNLLVRNDAVYGGGFAGCNGSIRNCTLVGNCAAYGSGLDGCNGSISNCIIWQNGVGEKEQIENCSTPTYSCIERWDGGGIGNINVDPCFVLPGYWDTNGVWVDGDYHLKSQGWRWDAQRKVWTWDDVTSRCIDAGNPGSPLGEESLSVPGDPNNIWGQNLRINMGAFGGTAEASMPPYDWVLLSDITNDGISDFSDLEMLSSLWLNINEQLYADFTRDGDVDFIDFALLAQDWLKQTTWHEAPDKPGLSKYYVAYDNPIEPNAPGYTLPLDLTCIENYDTMDSRFGLESSKSLLEENGFAIIEYDFQVSEDDRDDIVTPYEYLQNMDVPLFITADTLLHLYHIQFDETLKDVEEREFCSDIQVLTAALLDEALTLHEEYTGDLQEAAWRNVAYLAVAQQLIEPEAAVPELVSDVVASELAKIDAHAGFAPSDIFIYLEDYSQYIPRGHYTRSAELERYFRTLMWYGRMAFLLKGAENWGPVGDALISVHDAKLQTLQAVLLAKSLEAVQVGERTGREIWDRIYAVTSFYVGLADDLTPYEYLGAVNKVFGSSFILTDLEDEDDFFALKVELALLRSPEIFGGTGNVYVIPPVTPESLDEVLDKTKGMRFIGQRFIPDSYMFQQLVFPQVLDYTGDGEPFTLGWTGASWARTYPRGLDVMAILGSARAETVLAAEGDTDYIDYTLRFGELKDQFEAFDVSDWNRNLYWGWLYSLRALIGEFSEGYPNFMRTEAWEKKELNAALASWTELRHDTILYAKQSYTPPYTSVPNVTGYVEPVPEFYGRLLALTSMTREGLSDFDVLSAEAINRLVSLENILRRLIEIVNKELINQELSDNDYCYIREFGKTLEEAILGVEEEGVKTTLVADVHTHGVEGQVVEEGVGYVDLIIAACSRPDGGVFLAAGPVMSYYEFKHPMSDRLTDEAWRELLGSPEKPAKPLWFQPLMH